MTVDQAGAIVNILRPTDAYKRQLIGTKKFSGISESPHRRLTITQINGDVHFDVQAPQWVSRKNVVKKAHLKKNQKRFFGLRIKPFKYGNRLKGTPCDQG